MLQKNTIKKKTINRHQVKNDLAAWLLLLPLVIVMYLFVWRPSVMGGVLSFCKMKGYSSLGFIGLENYMDVITDTEFIPTLWNTVKYVLYSLLVGYIPPVLIAVMINEMLYFRSGYKVVIYLPAVIPAVAAQLIWYFLYYPDATGLFNGILTHIGLEPYIWLEDAKFTILYIVISMTWSGLPATMMLYFAALQSVRVELYEAALIDGAGMLKRFWYVTIPQIKGVLLITFVKQIIGVFQVLEQPMTMTGGGPNGASTSFGYQLYKYGFVTGRIGHAMALGVIIFLILMIMTVFYFYINKKVEDEY